MQRGKSSTRFRQGYFQAFSTIQDPYPRREKSRSRSEAYNLYSITFDSIIFEQNRLKKFDFPFQYYQFFSISPILKI